MLSDTWNHGESPERYPVDTGRLRRVRSLPQSRRAGARPFPRAADLDIAAHYSFVSYVAAVVKSP